MADIPVVDPVSMTIEEYVQKYIYVDDARKSMNLGLQGKGID